MGHSEMLLAVAGLEPNAIQELTQNLSSGDFTKFSATEGLAYSWAYRLSKQPAAITAADFALLQQVFGDARAVDIVWYIAWCNYMTRVADAFQLPLEEENVFAEAPAPK
jgi:hypothetical protein